MEDRLRKFAHLVDAGSFTKASQELHISQPALSTAISKLERELRAQLIIRGPRELQLTEAGKLAYATAKELIVSTHNLSTRLTALRHEQPNISIGMIDSIARALFWHSNDQTVETQAKLSLVVNNSRSLVQAVAHNDLDIAFTATPMQLPPNLTGDYVATEPLVLVCHRTQADKINESLRRGILPQFISYDQPSTTHRLIATTLQQHDLRAETIFFSTSPEVMVQLVLLQRGAAALPYQLVSSLVDTGTLVLIGLPRPIIIDRRIHAIHSRDQELPAIASRITARVQALVARQYNEARQL